MTLRKKAYTGSVTIPKKWFAYQWEDKWLVSSNTSSGKHFIFDSEKEANKKVEELNH